GRRSTPGGASPPSSPTGAWLPSWPSWQPVPTARHRSCTPPSSAWKAPMADVRPTDVAIVGMGAVFPGAGDVPTFWRNICDGVDSITDVPASRWDPDLYFDPTAVNGHSASDRFYCRRGGFVDGLADFDPAAFGVMPNAVAGTEPDQLLALRTAAEAIADAGGDDRLP